MSTVLLVAHVSMLQSCADTDDGDAGAGDANDDGATGDTTGGDRPPIASDECSDAPTLGAGRWQGHLGGFLPAAQAVCTLTGPEGYVRAFVPARADVRIHVTSPVFAPVLAIEYDDCVRTDPFRAWRCEPEGAEVRLDSVRGGTTLLVAIGVRADDPALGELPPESGESLPYELEITYERVLDVGDACSHGEGVGGRCPAGSACQPENAAATAPLRCMPLFADTCATAQTVVVMDGSSVVVPGGSQHTNAHRHTCSGASTAERVVRLELPADIPRNSGLTVFSPQQGVALAARNEGCLAAHERACASFENDGVRLRIPGVYDLAQRGIAPFVFIEYEPDAVNDDLAAPDVELHFTVVPGVVPPDDEGASAARGHAP